VLAQDSKACIGSLQNGEDMKGNIVLVERGDCMFIEKARVIQVSLNKFFFGNISGNFLYFSEIIRNSICFKGTVVVSDPPSKGSGRPDMIVELRMQ